MSREIKFRAWDKKTLTMHRVLQLEWNTDNPDEWYAIHLYPLRIFYRDEMPRVELMQFTGLRDKNGKEIYEGDLFKDRNGNTRDVHWGEREAGWCSKCLSDTGHHPEFDHERISHGSLLMHDAEVIGNIHENPELVK